MKTNRRPPVSRRRPFRHLAVGPIIAPGTVECRLNMSHSVQRRVRFVLAVSLYAVAIAWGLATAAHSDRSEALDLLLQFAFTAAISYWCVVDARVVGHPVVVVLALIGYLIYGIAWFGIAGG